MIKNLVILAIGLAIGYSVGYKDHAKYNKTIVQRMVERAGGSNRGKYNQDLDKATDSVK